MNVKTRETLERFVAKAHRLHSGGFVKSITEQGLKVSFSVSVGKMMKVEKTFPSEDEVDALILTLRFFIQNNESTSLANLSSLETDPGLSPNWKHQYRRLRDAVNGYLDKGPEWMDLRPEGTSVTCREILYVFVYGELAHTNEEKAARFREWESTPLIHFLELEFYMILVEVLRRIFDLAAITEMELLQGNPVPPV